MQVYVVVRSAYWAEDGSYPCGVFSTLELAEAYIAQEEVKQEAKGASQYPDSWDVHEFTVDEE